MAASTGNKHMLDRRGFLTRSLVLGCSVAASPLITPVSFAAAPWDNRLVVIILRGGMDGIDLLRPIEDPLLTDYRPDMDRTGQTPLGAGFALHPKLAPLMPMWQAGELAFAHAVSTPYRDKRSHFDGQDLLEAGHQNLCRLLGPAVEVAHPALGCRTLDDLPHAAPNSMPVEEGDLALVQFSSGTTVGPKPVALSHRAVVAQTVRLNGFWPDGNGVIHSGASWLPLYHDMGLIGCVFPALERCATLTLMPPELFVARPAAWLRIISQGRAGGGRGAATVSATVRDLGLSSRGADPGLRSVGSFSRGDLLANRSILHQPLLQSGGAGRGWCGDR
jgi:hypothetical protein